MTNETELLKRAQSLEKEAFAEIYDAYSDGIYRYAFRLLGDTYLAEECVADTFSRLFRVMHNGKGPKEHLRAYLYRIAHNWATDHYRKAQPDMKNLEQVELIDQGPALIEGLDISMKQAWIRQAITQLTDEQQKVITLKYLEGWENKEIAQAIEKPVGAVKSLQQRGLASLRRKLAQQEESHEPV